MSAHADRKLPTVACPTCQRPALFAPQNPWRPFCSERCRSVDLGAWANESYRVETKPEDQADDDGAAPIGGVSP